MFKHRLKITVLPFCLLSLLLFATSCQLIKPEASTLTPDLISPVIATTDSIAETNTGDVTAEGLSIFNDGPWLLLNTTDGLWVQYFDGSVIKKVYDGSVIAPADLNQGFARSTNHLAFITGKEYSELTLTILKLPEGSIVKTIPITSSASNNVENIEICNPDYEAARAATIAKPVAWSPDQTQLAFTGVLDGETSDVYVYDMADQSITKISEEPGQAYDLQWSSKNQTIAFFSADCFGTGAGFSNAEIWATNAQTGQANLLIESTPEISGREFVTWGWSGADLFITASISGCPYRDLRIVDIENQSTSIVYEGCFDDYAVGPTGSLAIVVGKDFSTQPGVYIYPEPDIAGIPPIIFSDESARTIKFISSLLYIQTISQNDSMIYALDWKGNVVEQFQKSSFPVISKDESVKAWSENEKIFLTINESDEPLELCQSEANLPFWYEAEGDNGEIYQYLLYGCTAPEKGLFLMSNPGYASIKVSSDIELVSEPIFFFNN